MAGATTVRLPGDGRRWRRDGGGGRSRLEGAGHRAAAPARADRPRRLAKKASRSKSRISGVPGKASTCASCRCSHASSRPWSPPGCRCCARSTRSRSRRRTNGSKRRSRGCAPTSRREAASRRRWSATRKSSTASTGRWSARARNPGGLEDALDRIAYQVEKTDALRRQVKSALMYPALIFGFAMVVLVAVVAFVIPVFVGIFEQIAEENPGETSELPLPDPDLRHRLRPRSPATGSSSSRD